MYGKIIIVFSLQMFEGFENVQVVSKMQPKNAKDKKWMFYKMVISDLFYFLSILTTKAQNFLFFKVNAR